MADPRWPPFDNRDLITTSYDVSLGDADLEGDTFRRTNYPLSLTVIAFYSCEVIRGGGGGSGGTITVCLTAPI